MFSAPIWLRDLGLLAWFLVGLIIILVALVWLFAVTAVIVGPVIVGAILATAAGPLVTKMQGRIGRAGGAAIVLLGLLALGALITLLVVGGLYEQSGDIKSSYTCATVLFRSGWNAAQVCRQLGHSDPGFTLKRYVHLLDADLPEPTVLDAAERSRVGNRWATRPTETDRSENAIEGAEVAV